MRALTNPCFKKGAGVSQYNFAIKMVEKNDKFVAAAKNKKVFANLSLTNTRYPIREHNFLSRLS